MKIILKMLAYLAILLSDAPCANVILQFFAPLHRTLKLCMSSWREIDQSPPFNFSLFFGYIALIIQRSHPQFEEITNLFDTEIAMFQENK